MILGLAACIAGSCRAQDAVSLSTLHSELNELRREVAELRVAFHQNRIAGLERGREEISTQLKHLQQQEAELRDRVENFDRQLASAPLAGDERAQAEIVRAEAGGQALEQIGARRAAVAATLSAYEQQLNNERRRLDEAIVRQQQLGQIPHQPSNRSY
jgi:chromosome segregation ATPase